MSIEAAYGPTEPTKRQTLDQPVRCPSCGKLLMELASRPWRATCPRCKTKSEATEDGIRVQNAEEPRPQGG